MTNAVPYVQEYDAWDREPPNPYLVMTPRKPPRIEGKHGQGERRVDVLGNGGYWQFMTITDPTGKTYDPSLIGTLEVAHYRLWDGQGLLVYTGVSNNPRRRLMQHRSRAKWREVAQVTIEWHESGWPARRAERVAHLEEHPRYKSMK